MWKNGHRCSSLFLAILIPYPSPRPLTSFFFPILPMAPTTHYLMLQLHHRKSSFSKPLWSPFSHLFFNTMRTYFLPYPSAPACLYIPSHKQFRFYVVKSLVSPNCTLFPLCSSILSVHQNTNLFCPFSWWTPHHFPTYEELFFLFKKNFTEAYFTHNSPFPRIQFNDFLSKFTKLYNQHHKSVLEYFIT